MEENKDVFVNDDFAEETIKELSNEKGEDENE